MFDSELPVSSFSVMCSKARMYEINYIDQQSQDKNRCGQLAVGSRQSAFTPSADRIDCLYGERGSPPVVKWDSHYY